MRYFLWPKTGENGHKMSNPHMAKGDDEYKRVNSIEGNPYIQVLC